MVLTAVLPNILEDALAVALAAAVGYLALLNLPLRRGEAKAKVERVAANFAKVAPALTSYKTRSTCLLWAGRGGHGAGGASKQGSPIPLLIQETETNPNCLPSGRGREAGGRAALVLPMHVKTLNQTQFRHKLSFRTWRSSWRRSCVPARMA